MVRYLLRMIALAAAILLAAPASAQQPPAAPREFRGMWIATVWNIDWPSRKGLSPDQMRSELRALIQSARQARMNAIVLQVRSYSDAIYPSPLDPWSEFVTGNMGQAPGGGFDPLQFAVDECHRNGLQLHVWVNPFRAGVVNTVASDKHISRRYPNSVRRIGTRLWADPGDPTARKFALDVVRDIVTRYDIDAIHYDDKGFYPYPAELRDWGGISEFPDEDTFRRFGRRQSRTDWRRQNITSFLEESNQLIKSIRPQVMLGVSPFGIHKAGEPPGIIGTSAHDVLFTDCKQWLRRGLVDYMAPQLYWPIDSKGQPYEPLLRWWSQQNNGRRHMWPGLHTDKYSAEEIVNQILIARRTPGVTGHIHYSGRAILRNKGGVREALRQGPYAYDALVPLSPWLPSSTPPEPRGQIERVGGELRLRLEPGEGATRPFVYTVYARTGGQWSFATVPGTSGILPLPSGSASPTSLFIAATDRLGNESRKVQVPLR